MRPLLCAITVVLGLVLVNGAQARAEGGGAIVERYDVIGCDLPSGEQYDGSVHSVTTPSGRTNGFCRGQVEPPATGHAYRVVEGQFPSGCASVVAATGRVVEMCHVD